MFTAIPLMVVLLVAAQPLSPATRPTVAEPFAKLENGRRVLRGNGPFRLVPAPGARTLAQPIAENLNDVVDRQYGKRSGNKLRKAKDMPSTYQDPLQR